MARIKHLYIMEIDINETERVQTYLTEEEYNKTLLRLILDANPNWEECDENDIYEVTPIVIDNDKTKVTRRGFTQCTTTIWLVHREAKDGYTLLK